VAGAPACLSAQPTLTRVVGGAKGWAASDVHGVAGLARRAGGGGAPPAPPPPASEVLGVGDGGSGGAAVALLAGARVVASLSHARGALGALVAAANAHAPQRPPPLEEHLLFSRTRGGASAVGERGATILTTALWPGAVDGHSGDALASVVRKTRELMGATNVCTSVEPRGGVLYKGGTAESPARGAAAPARAAAEDAWDAMEREIEEEHQRDRGGAK
jgi:hypothetical protein